MSENTMGAIENIPSENSPSVNMNNKEMIAPQVKGKVKWFNVDLGYGFINRYDNNEDVFVHHTAISKYNPKHQLSSLADGELVEFDVVKGRKGLEASNVSGPNGDIVKGSRYATNYYAGLYRFRPGPNFNNRRVYGRRFYGARSSQNSNQDDGKRVPNSENQCVPFSEKNTPETENEKSAIPTTKKYSKNRKVARVVGERTLRRSNSLPPDFGRYANGAFQEGGRRRRRFGRGGWMPFRYVYNAGKRRGRRESENEKKGGKGKGIESQKGVESDNVGKVETQEGNEGKTEVQSVTTEEVLVGKRSSKSETTLKSVSEKSETSDKSRSAKRDTKPKNSKSESGGNGKRNGQGKRSGKQRRRRFTTGPRGSSTEASTQTPSAKESEEVKSTGGADDGKCDEGKYASADEGRCEEAKYGSADEDKCSHGGEGDGADVKGEVVG